jgi:hypothetical protein
MTAVVTQPRVEKLTDNDYVVTSDQPRPSITSDASPWSMSVNYHLWPETPVLACVYIDDNRITVGFGGCTDDLTLYLTADQIDRLVAVLRSARRRLR